MMNCVCCNEKFSPMEFADFLCNRCYAHLTEQGYWESTHKLGTWDKFCT